MDNAQHKPSHDRPNGHQQQRANFDLTNPAAIRGLDDLAGLSSDELRALYAAGHAPQLGVLAGHTHGRFLAFPAVRRLPRLGSALGGRVSDLIERGLARLAGTRLMPWRGKTFAPPGEHHRTEGSNDVLGRSLLPFAGHVEKSALDHAPTLVLRYDRADNPRLFRPVVDELREIARGVWLGPCHVRGPNGPVVLLWWAVAKA